MVEAEVTISCVDKVGGGGGLSYHIIYEKQIY